MALNFVKKSRHGTIYYFRRRVPKMYQSAIGKACLVRSLETGDRKLAIARSRTLVVHTDQIFQRLAMIKKSNSADGAGDIQFDYTMEVIFSDEGKPSSITVNAQPEEQEAVNSAIKAVMSSLAHAPDDSSHQSPAIRFSAAIAEYYQHAQIKPQTKATYRSKLDHASAYFGKDKDILRIGQADIVKYYSHILDTIGNSTSRSLYLSTVTSFLNWHRHRTTGAIPLTIKTLLPQKDTPDSDDRDAFTLDQLRAIFTNAKQYATTNPQKFWVSVAPVFLGCRIEELCQVNLNTDLVHDEIHGIWYLKFDGRPDSDGVTRKSMKKVSSWRSVPIHSSLVHHGFIAFLQKQIHDGFERPFQKEWKPRTVTSDLGDIVKWSHYISRWGGRELFTVAALEKFDATDLTYFHSMRHTSRGLLGTAGVTTEIAEAIAGRRYASSDAERYEKLKQNYVRLSVEGVERGLDVLSVLLDETMAQLS